MASSAYPRRHVVLAGDGIGARRQHLVQWVPASAEEAALRTVLVEIETEPEDLAPPHQSGGVDDVLGRDVVEDAQLVLGTPFAPVLELLGLLQHVRLGQLCHGLSALLGPLDTDASPVPRAQRLSVPSDVRPFGSIRRGERVSDMGRGGAGHQRGLLRVSVNDENIRLKLRLMRSASLVLASTECGR